MGVSANENTAKAGSNLSWRVADALASPSSGAVTPPDL
jgi:hypothetical protein